MNAVVHMGNSINKPAVSKIQSPVAKLHWITSLDKSSTSRGNICKIKTLGYTHDRARIRTWNLLIRSQTRYPLRHAALYQLFHSYILCYDSTIIHLFITTLMTEQQLLLCQTSGNLWICVHRVYYVIVSFRLNRCTVKHYYNSYKGMPGARRQIVKWATVV